MTESRNSDNDHRSGVSNLELSKVEEDETMDSTKDIDQLNRSTSNNTNHSNLEGCKDNRSRFRRFSSSRYTSKERWDNKQRTYVGRLFVTFNECLHDLNARNVRRSKMEKMAIFIHESMSNTSRNYHGVQHVFDVSNNIDDPLGILAALFHDCIYYHVDGQFTTSQEAYVKGAYEKNPQTGELIVTVKERDTTGVTIKTADTSTTVINETSGNTTAPSTVTIDTLDLVETIFGRKPGDKITNGNGLNEFLSAVVAVRMLEEHLTTTELAIIAACIEATIPFRNLNKINPFEKLFENMMIAAKKFQLKLSEQRVIESIKLSVLMANEDVQNFGSSDRLYFLDNTWNLLPELNISLRRQNYITTTNFQESMFKMNGFFNFLNPDCVVSKFRDYPEQDEINMFQMEARRNLDIGKKYVGVKLLAVSIVAAIAELTGGDAPISMFMGDLPTRRFDGQKLEDSLSLKSEEMVVENANCDNDVYRICYGGRNSETAYDTKNSPISAYLYAIIGDTGLKDILSKNKNVYPMDTTKAKNLLSSLPREIVILLTKNMSTVCVPRSDQLMRLSCNFERDYRFASGMNKNNKEYCSLSEEEKFEKLFEGIETE